MRTQRRAKKAQLPLIIFASAIPVVVIAYFAYDLLRPACDSIFEQTATKISATVELFKNKEKLQVGREQVQALTESSTNIAVYLKACCVAQISGHISADQLRTCMDGAKNYEANVVQASSSLHDAQLAHEQGNTQLESQKTAEANQSVTAASNSAGRLEKVAAGLDVRPSNSDPGPNLTPTNSPTDYVNLLSPDQGGQLLVSPNADWQTLITGKESQYVDSGPGGEAVFGFKGEKPTKFSKFALLILKTNDVNVKEFEIFSGNDSITGAFNSLGKFSTQNVYLAQKPYQEFDFSETTARYFKFKVISFYRDSWGRVTQIRLFGAMTK